MFELFENMHMEIQDMKSKMTTKEDLSKIEQKLIEKFYFFVFYK